MPLGLKLPNISIKSKMFLLRTKLTTWYLSWRKNYWK
ncbi:hypothetical protein MEQ_00846 [Candida albicans P87]|nr:hypothetical protein MG1_00857 [Candida albicans GC75]KGU13130.1 hypothetical protein MEQ_00846 [Candida albicans P87]KHC74183.1 putative SH3-domain-containing protein [Candida albicans P75016]